MALKKCSTAAAHGPLHPIRGIIALHATIRHRMCGMHQPVWPSCCLLLPHLQLVCAVRNSAEPNETISGRNFVGDPDEFTKHFNNLPELSGHVADSESPVPAFDQHAVPCGVAAAVRAKLSTG